MMMPRTVGMRISGCKRQTGLRDIAHLLLTRTTCNLGSGGFGLRFGPLGRRGDVWLDVFVSIARGQGVVSRKGGATGDVKGEFGGGIAFALDADHLADGVQMGC